VSLSFISPRGSLERRWIEFALLRDNVQHHLENGVPSPAFANLHRITEALGGKELELPAKAFREELLKAEPLLKRPVADLAISLRTRTVVERLWPIPPGAETKLLKDTPSTSVLDGRERELADVFGVLLFGLLRLTEGAADGDGHLTRAARHA
jgi:hypothetical protein